MTTDAPKVSVCIPTYRGADYLCDAIRSVLNQTFTDFELLVVDDASPEGIERLVGEFDDPRLSFIRNEVNLGAEGNWNRCISLAKGHYFKLLPHDDVLHPTCIERQVAILDTDENLEIALVFGSRDVLRPDGRRLFRRGYRFRPEGRMSGSAVKTDCIRWGTNLIGEPGAVLFRLELAREIGGFDARYPYVIDLDFWLRLLSQGDGYYLRESVSGFRLSKQAWSFKLADKQADEFIGFVKEKWLNEQNQINTVHWILGRVWCWFNNFARRVIYYIYLS